MKHKGSTMEYSDERVADLMRAYDEYIASCDHINMPEVFHKVINMPASRFWVSDIRASLVVSAIIRGDADLDAMRPFRKEMYLEIHRRVMQMKKSNPRKSISELCAIVVEQPAPKFYISPGRARVLIYRARRSWNAEKKRRHHLI